MNKQMQIYTYKHQIYPQDIRRGLWKAIKTEIPKILIIVAILFILGLIADRAMDRTQKYREHRILTTK